MAPEPTTDLPQCILQLQKKTQSGAFETETKGLGADPGDLS